MDLGLRIDFPLITIRSICTGLTPVSRKGFCEGSEGISCSPGAREGSFSASICLRKGCDWKFDSKDLYRPLRLWDLLVCVPKHREG